MLTPKNPKHCPKCLGNNITLENKVFGKDSRGKDTDIVILGMWICSDCGKTIGRRMSPFENDLNPDSI